VSGETLTIAGIVVTAVGAIIINQWAQSRSMMRNLLEAQAKTIQDLRDYVMGEFAGFRAGLNRHEDRLHTVELDTAKVKGILTGQGCLEDDDKPPSGPHSIGNGERRRNPREKC